MIVVRIKRESDGKMHLMPILKKVVLPSVKECMKNGGKIGMASIESSASIVVHVVIRVKSIPSSVGGCWVVGWDWSGSPCIICHTRVGGHTTMDLLLFLQFKSVSYCCSSSTTDATFVTRLMVALGHRAIRCRAHSPALYYYNIFSLFFSVWDCPTNLSQICNFYLAFSQSNTLISHDKGVKW